MVHSADPKPRASYSSEPTSHYISHQNQIDRKESTGDDENSDSWDRYPISWLLKLSNREKSETREKNFNVPTRSVLEDAQGLEPEEEEEEEEEDDLFSCNSTCFRAGDLVWAKAMASSWWPGTICGKKRGKISVSFFNGERGRDFLESEVVSFEKNFQAMWKNARGRSLEAIDCALAELGRRLVLGLKCPCQITIGESDGEARRRLSKRIVGSKEMVVFEPVEVLRFVHAVAMCAWIDEVETLNAVRNGAQLNAFRRYNYSKRDCIYRQTIRLFESGSTTDDDLEAVSMTQKAEVSNEEQEDRHNIFVDNVGGDSGICKEKSVGHLHTVLTHLRCLALDPFYIGTTGLQNENSISVCLKILKYKHLVCRKDLHLISEQAIHHEYLVEISSENEISLNSVSHDGSIAANLVLEENIGITNTDGTQESQFSINVWDGSKAVVNERTEDAKEYCSFTFMVECPTVELSAALMKHTPNPNGKTQIKRTQEILRLDSDGTQESQLSFNIQDSSKAVVNERTEDTEADSSITFMEECPTVEHSLALMKHTSDRNVETQIKSTQEVFRLDLELLPSESITKVTDEGLSEGKKNHSQCAASNSLVGVQQEKLLRSWKRLYATRSRDSPVSCVNAASKPSETNINSECPTSLHMKFPKDFKLPSKEELFKQFRPFGPLDYSKTRVFFYTGSAQVVFLHHLDAGAAYQYAKRKKIFFSQANVRFWLVRTNNLKTGPAQIPASLSFPSVGSSVSSLKSCLKTSTSENKKKKRKLHHVKFATGTEINSLSAAVTKHGASSQPESG